MLIQALLAALGLVALLLARYSWITRRRRPFDAQKKPVKALIVLGSGGHTAEMLKLLDSINKSKYSRRCYVVAGTDKMSGSKAVAKEQSWQTSPKDYEVQVIPRSREVGQSYVTSVGTTIYSLLFAARLVWRQRPDLVLANGPGTCIPVCASAFTYRLLGLMDVRIAYVESIARVRKLSLSGLLLYMSRAADVLFVQWPELQQRYPRSTYAGRLY